MWLDIKEHSPKVTNFWDYEAESYEVIKHYLCYTKHNSIIIASLEQWDEDLEPGWYDNSLEKWNLGINDGSYITHFQELPKPPKGL